MSSPASESGSSRLVTLDTVSIARLFFALLRNRFTGTLELPQPEPSAGQRTIWLRGGMPVFTDWVAENALLGEQMVDQGSLGAEQLERALQIMSASGARLGEVVVQLGWVDAQQLTQALRAHLTQKLLPTFKLKRGVVTVTPSAHEHGRDDGLPQLNVLGLIHLGVTQHYDQRRVEQEMGESVSERLTTTAAFERYKAHFGFPSTDAPLLAALARGQTLASLASTPHAHAERAAQLLFTLWACQMLQSPEAKATAARNAPPPEAKATAARNAPPPPPHPRTQATATTQATSSSTTSAKPPPASNPTPAAPTRGPATASSSASSSGAAQIVLESAPQVSRSSPSAGARSSAASPQSTSGPPPDGSGPRTPKPASTAATPLEAAAFMQELEAFEGLLAEGMHAFGLFGLSPDAGKADVRRAWGDLSRKFHPDALQSKKLGHLRERVEQVFAALSEAHMQLADDAQREDLKHLLEMGGGQLRPGQDASAVALAALESEVIAKEADKLLRGGHFKQALENYQRAAQMNPTELDLRAATAWCEYQVSARDEQAGRKAIGSLDAIIQEAPRLARAYYFRGLVMLALGNEDLAIGSFTEAHAIDPRLIDAERQARAIKIRRQNKGKVEDKSRFGLRNLFKK